MRCSQEAVPWADLCKKAKQSTLHSTMSPMSTSWEYSTSDLNSRKHCGVPPSSPLPFEAIKSHECVLRIFMEDVVKYLRPLAAQTGTTRYQYARATLWFLRFWFGHVLQESALAAPNRDEGTSLFSVTCFVHKLLYKLDFPASCRRDLRFTSSSRVNCLPPHASLSALVFPVISVMSCSPLDSYIFTAFNQSYRM